MSSGFDKSPANVILASTWSRITSTITKWRNWKLAVKLTAVVLVPVIFAVALGALQIRSQIRQAGEYSRLGTLVAAAGSVRSAITQLQEERTRAAEFLVRGPISAATVQGQFAPTDVALAHSTSALGAQDEDAVVVSLARDEVNRRISEIPGLRRQVMGAQVDPGIVVNSYSRIIGSLLTVDRTLLSRISSISLASTATTSHELAKISEEVHLQHALVLVGLLRGALTPETIADVRDSETRRAGALKEFRAAGTPQQRMDYDLLYVTPEVPARDTSLRSVMIRRDTSSDDSTPAPPVVPPQVWNDQSKAALKALGSLQSRMDEQLGRTAYALRENASNMAGLESVILLTALLIAGAVVVVVARQLLGSLEGLRRRALDAANHHLPQAVADIRSGRRPRGVIDRVSVDTTEEVGQVARAFDDVQTQAVNLAAEQAELRKSYRDSFVNVSRRSQSLLERQLRLFEQLERDEEDPDQLATLFQLDHLATRMRRNNENLMVLSGTDPARRFTQSATPADLVRAAVSEIEHYPRVVVQPLPDTRIVGYAASDLVRLLAELLDNAANFSPPHTNVIVSGHRRGDGSVGIDIVDRGIGMSSTELAAANQRLTTDGEIDVSTSRRMGLFVVGRLATRHGIGVRLHTGPSNTGVRVTVSLRSELLLDGAAQMSSARTNGAHAPISNSGGNSASEPVADSDAAEDTLVEAFDWVAAEQDATNQTSARPAPPSASTRNGFHLLDGAGRSESVTPGRSDGGQESGSGASRAADVRRTQQDLFSPQQDDDHSARPGPGQHNGVEVPTPIFDDLASAWFQVSHGVAHPDSLSEGGGVRWPARPGGDGSKGTFLPDVEERFPYSQAQQGAEPSARRTTTPNTDPHQSQPDPDAPRDAAASWTFTSDHARRRAEEVSAAEPEDYTSVGLPMRVPRAHLIAGSAGNNGSTTNGHTHRDPDVARDRLASFQRGLRRGRHRNANEHPSSADPASDDKPVSDWIHGADTTSQQAEPAPASDPADYTSAGLPRRTPRAQTVPAAADESASDSSQRDADLMRGRLASFQRGVRQGKHCLREPADEPAEDHL